MLLSELLKNIPPAEVVDFAEAEISDITCDSRKCTSGSIFVALDGEHYSAESFVYEAVKNGATAVITENKKLLSLDLKNTILFNNARKTMAEISKMLYGNVLEKMMLIGVTGTKGKTTTALYLMALLRSFGVKVALTGTLGSVGVYDEEPLCAVNTTPESCELYRFLKRSFEEGAEAIIIEVSSQALKSFRVFGIPFYALIFTNLSEDHIGPAEHCTYEDYYASKRSLFRDYGAKIALLNARDPMARHIAPDGMERVFVACESAECTDPMRSAFLLFGERYEVFGGEYNCVNAALAVAAARRLFSVTYEYAASVIGAFRAEGRFEAYGVFGKTVIIDYAHNARSVRAVLSAAAKITSGRIIAVFGSVGMRSFGRRRALSEACESCADLSIITADNPDEESVFGISAELYSYFKDKRRALIITDRSDAIIYAVSNAKRGDTVVLLGKGHERFQLINGERRLFSERAIIIAMGGQRL